jgi:hypothetical protein
MDFALASLGGMALHLTSGLDLSARKTPAFGKFPICPPQKTRHSERLRKFA